METISELMKDNFLFVFTMVLLCMITISLCLAKKDDRCCGNCKFFKKEYLDGTGYCNKIRPLTDYENICSHHQNNIHHETEHH